MCWIEIAELSSDTFTAVQRITRQRPGVDRLLFRDDPSTRRSLADAYDRCCRKSSACRVD